MSFVHTLDPIIVQFGPIAIRYYSLAYIIGILSIIGWFHFLRKRRTLPITSNQTDMLLIYLTLGVILGGRIGYMTFYQPQDLFSMEIFRIWQGGMSFHGGLLGAIVALLLFTKRRKLEFLELADMLVIPATIGLFLGRIANFINGELVGRVTNVPWCVIFPDYDTLCRHPSQLYEAGKNLALFIVLTPLVMANTLKKGTVFAFFLIGYGLLRFTITFLREDTVFLGLSQGQYLSLATALAGIIVYCVIHFRADAQKTPRT